MGTPTATSEEILSKLRAQFAEKVVSEVLERLIYEYFDSMAATAAQSFLEEAGEEKWLSFLLDEGLEMEYLISRLQGPGEGDPPRHPAPAVGVESPDLDVKNFAPDSDSLLLTIEEWKIAVWRDEDGEVHLKVEDGLEGSRTDYVLGKEGYTQFG